MPNLFGDPEPEPSAEQRAQRAAAHVSQNTGDNEWYTPPEIITRARAFLGAFDLDPASSDVANTVVQAARYYTAENSALTTQSWAARDGSPSRVWMNPPYAQPLCRQFIDRLVDEHRRGRVLEALVLVNNATETAWFQALAGASSAVLLFAGRVRFWAPGKVATPLQGQALLYLGPRAQAFCSAFAALGTVLCRPSAPETR